MLYEGTPGRTVMYQNEISKHFNVDNVLNISVNIVPLFNIIKKIK